MLRPFISHSFRSPVWRLEIDSQSNTLAAEVRDPSDKKVYFSSVSLETGKINFEDLETEERWLTGLETAYGGVLLLHHYESGSGPVHKGLTAIDELTGKVLWSNFNLAFDFLSINGPIVYDTRLQPRKLLLADIKTGATVRAYEPSIDLELYK
ncbi:MAG TPA: DUF4905 domain-containing protein, partial [Mucilaginibacter sp.]|nr:DUF4905 domain-containing protein [Mucilaginibacter sp.]